MDSGYASNSTPHSALYSAPLLQILVPTNKKNDARGTLRLGASLGGSSTMMSHAWGIG